jgi:hypothetical protein
MYMTWPAAACTTGKAVQLCFGTGSVGAGFFMSDVDPLNAAFAPYGIIYFVKAIACYRVNSFDAGIYQHLYQLVCNFFCHCNFDYLRIA